ITLAGQTNKYVGWSQAGVFTPITSVCDTNSGSTTIDSGLAFPAGGNCKYDDGTDMIIWTKHFSTFIAYFESSVSTQSSGGGGGGGGISIPTPVQIQTVATTTAQGQVLGAAVYNFTADLRV